MSIQVNYAVTDNAPGNPYSLQLLVLADSDSMQQQICTKERKWEKGKGFVGEGALGCDIAHGVSWRCAQSQNGFAMTSGSLLESTSAPCRGACRSCMAIRSYRCQGEDVCYSCLSMTGVK